MFEKITDFLGFLVILMFLLGIFNMLQNFRLLDLFFD